MLKERAKKVQLREEETAKQIKRAEEESDKATPRLEKQTVLLRAGPQLNGFIGLAPILAPKIRMPSDCDIWYSWRPKTQNFHTNVNVKHVVSVNQTVRVSVSENRCLSYFALFHSHFSLCLCRRLPGLYCVWCRPEWTSPLTTAQARSIHQVPRREAAYCFPLTTRWTLTVHDKLRNSMMMRCLLGFATRSVACC